MRNIIMRRIIGKLLILIGFFIIVTVIYTNYTTYQSNSKLIQQYKDQSCEEDTSPKELHDVIGILIIPKINLEVAIKNNTNSDTLKDAVGHFEGTVMPGEYGNFSVAGHRAYTSNKFFSNLDELEIGDEIKVLSKGNLYKYIVESMEIVTPDRIEVLNGLSKDRKEITLVTCTPKLIGSHRLIVKGKHI